MTIALVTGITGFVGGHLADALRSDGVEVVGVTRDPAFAEGLDNVFLGDVMDRNFISALVHSVRPNLVFHLAANKARTGDFDEFRLGLESNLFGTLNLVEACINGADVQRFIAIGTCEEYGGAKPLYHEEMRESPVSAYSLSKTAVTHLLQTLYRTHGFPIVVLRPSLAYGPGQATDMFLPALIHTLLNGKPFAMSGGEQTRDFVYIDDLVESILLSSIEPKAVGKVINISSGVPVSLKDIAKITLQKISGDLENLLEIGKMSYRANEIMDYTASCELAGEILGWRPHTSLDDGLTATVEHLRTAIAETE